MNKQDGRKLTRQTQYERRKQAVQLHMRGMKVDDIAATLSMGHVTVRAAIKTANKGGIKALQPKPTGRPVGSQRRLSPEQELQIQRKICKHRPKQLKLEFALWSRAAGQTGIWHQLIPAHHGRVPQALELYPTKTDQESLRAAS